MCHSPVRRGTSRGFYSFEVDFAEREEWYSKNTSTVLPSGLFPAQPAVHSRYNAQKPKVSIRWQPLDPKYIGALTLRGSYTEAFHAPTSGRTHACVLARLPNRRPIRFPLRPSLRLRNAF